MATSVLLPLRWLEGQSLLCSVQVADLTFPWLSDTWEHLRELGHGCKSEVWVSEGHWIEMVHVELICVKISSSEQWTWLHSGYVLRFFSSKVYYVNVAFFWLRNSFLPYLKATSSLAWMVDESDNPSAVKLVKLFWNVFESCYERNLWNFVNTS